MKIKIWEIWNYSEEDAEEVEVDNTMQIGEAVESFAARHHDDWECPDQMDINVRSAVGALWEFSVSVDYAPVFRAHPRKREP